MIEDRLESLGISLPEPPIPAGSYVPVVRVGDILFVSGQIPVQDGRVAFTGKVSESNLEEARRSARLCAINILAQIRHAVGSLDRVERVVKMSGFVNSEPGFAMQPKVINGASDMMYEVFGEKGKHSRVAVSVPGLPLDSMTEIDAIVKVC